MAGRPPRTEEVKVVFLRLPTDLLKRVTRCTGMIETREGVRLDQTKAFRHLLEIACDAVEHQQTPLAPLTVSEKLKLVEISNIADGTPPAYDDMLACLGEEDEEETPALPTHVPQAAETVTESQNGEIAIPSYDATKYVLGKLCPQRHEWGTTGQSRLTIRDRVCPECRNALKRRKRAEKRHGQPA
jgi:hypothetical protein